jgi:hypothetical protein
VTPAPAFCAERQALVEVFVHAVREYMRMRSAGVAALTRGGPHLFEAEIEAARQRKVDAKLALRLHQAQHGC